MEKEKIKWEDCCWLVEFGMSKEVGPLVRIHTPERIYVVRACDLSPSLRGIALSIERVKKEEENSCLSCKHFEQPACRELREEFGGVVFTKQQCMSYE